jgi:hypothetical protein
MTAAQVKLDEREKQRPKGPQRPFLDGVYTFPLQPTSLAGFVAVSVLVCLIGYLVQVTIDMEGLGQILGIFVMMIAGILAFVTIALSTNQLMDVLHWTAMGYPDIQESTGFELFEVVRKICFVINAFAVSALPGVLLAVPFSNLLVRFALLATSVFWFYPFVMLSMVDGESAISFYSSFIKASFKNVRSAWLKLYASVAVLFGIAAVPHLLDRVFPHIAWLYVALCLTFALAMIYFRLLGRLAWVIDQQVALSKKPLA